MTTQPQISQRDLRLRSKEIMDAVEHGESFTVTRDGHQIGELIPLRRRRTFLSREEFLAGRTTTIPVDPDRFRADLDAAVDNGPDDPYAR
ncbi:MAG: prevent-host-death protein [Nocardioidaceae bacterium]